MVTLNLTDLSADDLGSVLCACDAPSLCAVQAVCTALRSASLAPDVWNAVLAQDYGVCHARAPRELYRYFRTTPAAALPTRGFLTDGGLDSLEADEEGGGGAAGAPSAAAAVAALSAAGGEQQPLVLEVQQGSEFWVGNAFAPTEFEFYCSQPSVRNVTIAGALLGERCATQLRRETELERRAYILERLTFIAQRIWLWSVDGFGGLGSCSTHTLERALVSAWSLPQVRLRGGRTPR